MSDLKKRPPLKIVSSFDEADYPYPLTSIFDAATLPMASNDEHETVYQFKSDNDEPETSAAAERAIRDAMAIARVENYHIRTGPTLVEAWFKSQTDRLVAEAALEPNKPYSFGLKEPGSDKLSLEQIRRKAKGMKKLFADMGGLDIEFVAEWKTRAVQVKTKSGHDFIQFIGQLRGYMAEYSAEMK